MKYLILGLVFGLSIVAAFNVFALSWNELSSFGKKSVEVKAFQIPTSGTNLRGYEYISPAGKICTVTLSDKKGMTSSCSWPKSECK